MTHQTTIYISQTDSERLQNLIELVRNGRERSNLSDVSRLEGELEYAEVIAPQKMPPDIEAIMNAKQLAGEDFNRIDEMYDLAKQVYK